MEFFDNIQIRGPDLFGDRKEPCRVRKTFLRNFYFPSENSLFPTQLMTCSVLCNYDSQVWSTLQPPFQSHQPNDEMMDIGTCQFSSAPPLPGFEFLGFRFASIDPIVFLFLMLLFFSFPTLYSQPNSCTHGLMVILPYLQRQGNQDCCQAFQNQERFPRHPTSQLN